MIFKPYRIFLMKWSYFS